MPLFLLESSRRSGPAEVRTTAGVAAFAAIGVGALGCLAAGVFADRYGRTLTTILSMVGSGTCCLLIGLLFGGNTLLMMTLVGPVGIHDCGRFGPPAGGGTRHWVAVCIRAVGGWASTG